MKITIEKEWNADDICEYCLENKIGFNVISQNEIYKIEPHDFFKNPFFCNTKIVQKNLKKCGLESLIPKTYPAKFDDLYQRKIRKIYYKNILNYSYPYFIKSASNDKSIDGTIIKNAEDLLNLWIINEVKPEPDLELFIADVVEFEVEYRLLIGNDKIYGIGYQKGDKSIFPNKEFINKLIQKSYGQFYCIDIGYINIKKIWSIVEVNPPFSLDDYGIKIDNYVAYAIDFWKTIELKKID